MLAAARADGVALRPDDCYRPASPVGGQVQLPAAGATAPAPPARARSMHGWGEAVDFRDAGGSLTFSSSGYRWLKANGARYGWNHPRWAEPGGSACPEAWHWEWVGDGGRMRLDPIRADVGSGSWPPRAAGTGGSPGSAAWRRRGGAADAGSPRREAAELADQGRRGHAVGPGLLDGRLRRRDLQLRRCGVLRVAGSVRLNRPIVGMAATRVRWRLLAGGVGRWDLQLR